MTKPKARTGDVIPPVRNKPQVAIEDGMADSVIFSLIYGPVAVTLGCWLFFAGTTYVSSNPQSTQ
jgi:hypothetical protein